MPSISPAGRPLALVLALLAALPATAQDAPVVEPGSDLLDLSRVATGATHYTVTVVQGQNRQQVGTVTRTVAVDEAAGEATVVLATEMMGNKFVDTTVVAWPSFAARHHRSENPQRRLRFDVADGRLSGEMTPAGGQPEAFEMTVDGPIFDSAVMGDLIAALPLDAGYAATLPAYEYEAGGLADFTVRVVGSDKVTPEGKALMDVWVVEPHREGQEQTIQYAFTKQGHRLARIHVVPQPGIEVFVDAE